MKKILKNLAKGIIIFTIGYVVVLIGGLIISLIISGDDQWISSWVYYLNSFSETVGGRIFMVANYLAVIMGTVFMISFEDINYYYDLWGG